MREIEFRGKRKDNGEWVYGFVNYIHSEWRIHNSHNHYDDIIEGETVGQYTGLKDRHSKKVYEGDIVKIFSEQKPLNDDGRDYLDEEKEYIRKVEIEEASFGLLSTFGGFIMGSLCNPTVEVIGNYHDNPELIKETNNE